MPHSYEEEEENFLRSEKSSKVFRRLVGEILSHRRDSGVLITAVIITAIAGTLYPLALGFAINGVINKNFTDLFIYSAAFLGFYIIQFFLPR